MRIGVIAAVAIAVAAGIAIATVLFFYAPPSAQQLALSNPSTPGGINGANSTNQASSQAGQGSSGSPTTGYSKVYVTVNNYTILADIADTPQRMEYGLDVRDSMNESQGMLFPFALEAQQGFWMKGMKFPIDIIWIDKDKKVVHIEPSLVPCTPLSCPTYTPAQPAMYVLETVSGFAAKHNVTEGTVVSFALSQQFR